jgi:hypothetical protein
MPGSRHRNAADPQERAAALDRCLTVDGEFSSSPEGEPGTVSSIRAVRLEDDRAERPNLVGRELRRAVAVRSRRSGRPDPLPIRFTRLQVRFADRSWEPRAPGDSVYP